jgi:hypothetical protein
MTAYHYTDMARLPFILARLPFILARLPFILASGHLRPSRHIRAKVCPDVPPGVTCFTTHHRGDPSAAAFHNGGAAPRIRPVVPLAVTLDWREACRRVGWSQPDIELAERRGRGRGARVDCWRAVPEPVSLAEVVDVHILRPGGVWRPMPEPSFRVKGEMAVIALEGTIYGIERRVLPDTGTTGYAVRREPERGGAQPRCCGAGWRKRHDGNRAPAGHPHRCRAAAGRHHR